jgi:uncharacterized protein YbjT (DUF2867 family)
MKNNVNIIVGASGQVGSYIIDRLVANEIPTIAVVRDPNKLKNSNLPFRQADLFNTDQVVKAFYGATTAFLLTPENPSSNDIIDDTKKIIENYRKAIEANKIKRIICLSSIGAHIEGKSGNLIMSKLLEKSFDNFNIEKIFVRPSYYFSNWLGYLSTIEQFGILPTFFPEELTIEMLSPLDLAFFIAEIIAKPIGQTTTNVYELVGPKTYNSIDISRAFSSVLNKEVFLQSIPRDKWKETLLSVGFTSNSADNLIDMTQAVVDGFTTPEFPSKTISLKTTIDDYLRQEMGLITTTR